ncbi:MAG: recombination protein RecR, partial [Kiritimatiellae bacterium]|nr:recombination protein RecR [Kiritimatiellia bacterium]
MIAPLAELELRLAKLPGFGRRSASRAALALVREPGRLAEPLMAALKAAHDGVRCCSRCGAFTTAES